MLAVLLLTLAAVPDASLRAMTGSMVRLDREDELPLEGKLVGFEEQWVTVIVPPNEEVISVPRDRIVRLHAVAPPAEPPRERIVGVNFGLSVSLLVDARYKLFYGFANGNVLFPLTSLAGTTPWLAFAVGAGIALPLVKGSRWFADMFGQVLPLHIGGAYSYVGVGVGVGLRYDSPAGFVFAVKLPVVGYSARVGRSPYGYDPPHRAGYGFGYYYLAALMGLPIVSVGYRF